jgi:hypothetical protein
VCGAADWPCRTNIVELPSEFERPENDPPGEVPPKYGVRTTAFEEPELEAGADEVAGGAAGREIGAERAGAE